MASAMRFRQNIANRRSSADPSGREDATARTCSGTSGSATDEDFGDSTEVSKPKFLVRSWLGPSLEDTVLRTLEFGKSLIDRPASSGEKNKIVASRPVESENKLNDEMLASAGDSKKIGRIPFKWEKKNFDKPDFYPELDKTKFVSKMRSLHSNLVSRDSSPERIRRQLEALVTIHRDLPHEGFFYSFGSKKIRKSTIGRPLNYTVMPAQVREGSGTQSDRGQNQRTNSQAPSGQCTGGGCTRWGDCLKLPPTLGRASEVIGTTLGPTLDASLIENLKMIRDLYRGDIPGPSSGAGEGTDTAKTTTAPPAETTAELDKSSFISTPNDMKNETERLRQEIDQLTETRRQLKKMIEDDERELGARRRTTFNEEDISRRFRDDEIEGPKIQSQSFERSQLQALPQPSQHSQLPPQLHPQQQEPHPQQQEPHPQQSRLRSPSLVSPKSSPPPQLQLSPVRRSSQHRKSYDSATEEKPRSQLRGSRSVMEAWDIIGSKLCHTKLPPLSRVAHLDKSNSVDSTASVGKKKLSEDSRCSNANCPEGCVPNSDYYEEMDLEYGKQRDITCGFHSFFVCSCNGDPNDDWSSDEEDIIIKHGDAGPARPCIKSLHSSKSESNAMHRRKMPRLSKVLWAVARINVFDNDSRTYEIMDTSSKPPKNAPIKTEGVFVVRESQMKKRKKMI